MGIEPPPHLLILLENVFVCENAIKKSLKANSRAFQIICTVLKNEYNFIIVIFN